MMYFMLLTATLTSTVHVSLKSTHPKTYGMHLLNSGQASTHFMKKLGLTKTLLHFYTVTTSFNNGVNENSIC